MTERPGDAGYLIVLKHLVVAADLAEIIRDFDAAARVETARTVAEGLARLDGLSGLAVALLGDDRDAPAWPQLVAAIEARGARIVLIPRDEHERPEPGHDFLILDRPFTTEMVLALLDGARG
ncbi:hypothetical protein [Frigidibacter oleivorans]|uniref:hypothetical protein n=1 Tax=Frigidibacter oleivorans TaxID=2487129 RepID=UPI000F8CA695|nr:hypothetical protein [Frigidibacter oleivorans]